MIYNLKRKMSSKISSRGYGISKDCISDIELLKDELTVKPYTPFDLGDNNDDKSFPVYLESSKKLYLPKYFGLRNYGIPDADEIQEGQPIDVTFKGNLRDYQQVPVQVFVDAARDKKQRGGILQLPPGWGKTVMALKIIAKLKVKTLIIVHKEFLMNQWVERIDQYIGNASVGIIKQNKTQTDNDIVIASLQSIAMRKYDAKVFEGFGMVVIDECFPHHEKIHTDKGPMAIGDLYELWSKARVAELPDSRLPAILSYNQGSKAFQYKQMTHAWRKEREDLLCVRFAKFSSRIINCTPEHKILTSKGYVKANQLKKGDLVISKHCRDKYDSLINPSLNDDQKQIIYGLLAAGQHFIESKGNRFRIRFQSAKKHGIWLERLISYGPRPSTRSYIFSKAKTRFYTPYVYFDNIVKLDDIPIDVWNKIDERGMAIWMLECVYFNAGGTTCNIVTKDRNNVSCQKSVFKKFGLEFSSRGDRNNHYLHFDVENTKKLVELVSPYIPLRYCKYLSISSRPYCWTDDFNEEGFMIVHSIEEKLNKGISTEQGRVPYVYDIEVEENHNFVIAHIDAKNSAVDGPIVSNCHHMGAEVFSRALHKVNFQYSLGLSATVNRKDGLTKVFKWFIGDIVYKAKPKKSDELDARIHYYFNSDRSYSNIPLLFNGKPNISRLITNICEYKPRTEFIIRELQKIMQKEQDRQVIVLSDRRAHLGDIEAALKRIGYDDIGYYVGAMKQSDLDKSQKKQFILGTYNMVSEGFDLPKLNTLVLASPKGDVEQSIGRIQRQLKEDRKHVPLVLDIVDELSLFINQGNKRIAFYKKKGYEISEHGKLNNVLKLDKMAFVDIEDEQIK